LIDVAVAVTDTVAQRSPRRAVIIAAPGNRAVITPNADTLATTESLLSNETDCIPLSIATCSVRGTGSVWYVGVRIR
jgi:hypothetical protein